MRPAPLLLPPSPVDDAWRPQSPRALHPRRRRSRLRTLGGVACVAAALLLLLQLRLAGRRVAHHMREGDAADRMAGSKGGAARRGQPSLAVLVPYRDRAEQLALFVPHIHQHLDGQGVAHVVVVAEQLGSGPFNRGALLNFAFLAVPAGTAAVAVVDVDSLPLPGVNFSDVGVHGFRHLAREPAQYDYVLPMPRFCGGALLVKSAVYAAVNGYSNGYWGWGGEDDDFCLRLMRQRRAQAVGEWGSDDAFGPGDAVPRSQPGHGRFATLDDRPVSADRLEFMQLNAARLRMWQLAAGEGACEEGLADLQPIWKTQSSLEERAGYLLVQVELPPELRPGIVRPPRKAQPGEARTAAEAPGFETADAIMRETLAQQLRRQAEAEWQQEHPLEPLDVLQQQSTVAAIGERFSGDVQGNERVTAWKKVMEQQQAQQRARHEAQRVRQQQRAGAAGASLGVHRTQKGL